MATKSKPELRAPQIRTFETFIILTGWPEAFDNQGNGKIEDLPARLQDEIHRAMERKSKELSLPLAVVMLRVDEDHDIPKETLGHYFLHVVLSEVVAVDMRGTRH